MSPPQAALLWTAVGALGVATAAALARMLRDRRRLAAAALGATGVALASSLAVVALRSRAVGHVPMVTAFDSMLVLVAALALLLLVLSTVFRGPALAGFLLPLMLAMLLTTFLMPSETTALGDRVPRAATLAHAGLTLGGAVALAFGAACAGMFLLQGRRLRQGKLDGLSAAMPSLEWLQRANRRAVAAGFPLLTAGLGVGMVLLAQVGKAVGLPLTDPKVILALAAWAVVAVLAGVSRRPTFRGRAVAWLTLAAFAMLCVTMVCAGLLWPTSHAFGRPVS